MLMFKVEFGVTLATERDFYWVTAKFFLLIVTLGPWLFPNVKDVL